MGTKFVSFEFNYADFTLNPYAGNNENSSQLLKNIIRKLNEEDLPEQDRIIDRYKNRQGNTKRRLVHISSPFGKAGSRCFGKIALIKNKAPMLWGGSDIIEEIAKGHNKQFIEVTNYIIDFNSPIPIIMYEFNNEGPRITDIEFFFRQIGTKYRYAKGIKSSIHLNIAYNDLEKEIDNIFDITVKVNAIDLNNSNWVKSLKTLSDETGYKDVKMELFFGRQKENGLFKKNIKGLDFARDILGWLKKGGKNIENFKDLKMTFQKSGSDEIICLDFIKNKTTSYLEVPLTDMNLYKSSDFKFIVGQEFNSYLKTGKTTNTKEQSDD